MDFLFRHLDGSSIDKFIQFGHFPEKPIWLSERYIAVNTMYGFGIYDLQAAPSYSSDAVFYIECNIYIGHWIVEPEQQSKTMTIRCMDTNTIIVGDSKTPLELGSNEQIILQFDYLDDGELVVEYSVEIYR